MAETSDESNNVVRRSQEPFVNRNQLSSSPNKSAEVEEQDTQDSSSFIDVTGVESELLESGDSNVSGHHEEWELSSLKNSRVSSAGSSPEKDSGHSMEKQLVKKKEFIRRFLNEAEAAFKAGEEHLNMNPSRMKVDVLDDVCDDDITDAVGLNRYLKGKQSTVKSLLLHEKSTPSTSSHKPMFKQTSSSWDEKQTTDVEEETCDSVNGTFNFTLCDSESSVQVVEHVKPSDDLKVNQKKKKNREGSLESATKACREFQNIPKLEKAYEKSERENKKRDKRRKNDKKKGKDWKKKKGNLEDEEEFKDQDNEDRKNETKEPMSKKRKKELKMKRKQRTTVDKGDEMKTSKKDAEKNEKNKIEKISNTPEIIVDKLSASNTVLSPSEKQKKKKKVRDLELFEDASEIPNDPVCDPIDKMKDSSRRKKKEKDQNLLLVEDAPGIPKSTFGVEDPVNTKKKKKKKKRREQVEEILQTVEPEYQVNDVPKKKKKKKKEVHDLEIIEGPREIIVPTDCANYAQEINKKVNIVSGMPSELIDSEKKRKKRKFQDVPTTEDIVQVVENLSNVNEASLVDETSKKKKKRRRLSVSKCEPLDQSFILSSQEQTNCTTGISKNTSYLSPDLFDDLLEVPRDLAEKAVKKRKKTKYNNESVCGRTLEKQQASLNESRESNGRSCRKKEKIKVEEFEEAPCTEIASTRSSPDSKIPPSPWHRLSRDSNGSFTGCSAEICTNSYQGSTQNDTLSNNYLGKCVNLRKKDAERRKAIKKVHVKAESTCEEILNCKTAIAHKEFSESSSEVEMQIWGRGNLKGLTQRTIPQMLGPSTSRFEGSSGYEPPVQSKTEILPTSSLLHRLSTKINEVDSDSSDSDSIRVSGRGNMRGLTQKFPTKGLNDAQNKRHQSMEGETLIKSQSLSSLDQCDEPVFKPKRTSEFKENIPRDATTQKSLHSDESSEKKTVRCTRCKVHFKSALLLSWHSCFQAPKQRNVSETYRIENAPFQCECGKRYSRQAYLNHHISATHNGIRPFQCDTCLMSFSEKQTLKVHQRIHSKVLPYECSLCGRCFIVHYNLNRHYKYVHKLVGKFPCNTCSSKNIVFFFKKDLEAHVELVHSKTTMKALNTLGS